MAVYVDNAENPFGRMLMCHMLADTIGELHAMAERIGMRRSWYQPFSFPHYDVAKGRRKEAVELGAIELDRRGVADLMKRLRNCPKFQAEWKESLHV